MKVHIIGVPSAGKTTLATGLSTLLDVPLHALDSVAFVDDQWTPRPAPERDVLVGAILTEPSYVAEGGFLGWTEGLLAAADHIVWLDPPLRVLVWRHVRRFWRHPWWVPALLRFQVQSYRRPLGAGPAKDDPDQTRAGIERDLRPWADKVLRCRRPITAAALIHHLMPEPQ